MKKEQWEGLFRAHNARPVSHAGNFFTVEELYQAFKARLQSELVTDTHGTSHFGVLVDKPSGDVE